MQYLGSIYRNCSLINVLKVIVFILQNKKMHGYLKHCISNSMIKTFSEGLVKIESMHDCVG